MSEVEILDQLSIRASFVKSIEILPLEIFDQRPLEAQHIIDDFDKRGNGLQTCASRGAPAALAGDQFELFVSGATKQYRLDHADCADRVHKSGQRFFVELGTRLTTVRLDERDGNLLQHRVCRTGGLRWNQRPKAATEAVT